MIRLAAGLGLGMLVLGVASLSAQPLEVARLGYVQGKVEQADAGSAWVESREGVAVHIGDRFRTGAASRARLDFPWMSVAISSNSVLGFPEAVVLSAVLERGRVEPSSAGSIIKLVTEEAAVRGSGRVIVRREGQVTWVSVREGRFAVEPVGLVAIEVATGQGLILRGGEPPGPVLELAPAPIDLQPGADPLYVIQGGSAELSWRASHPAYHVELLGHDGVDVVLGRDVERASASFSLPWLGTFRWRVAAIDGRGLEGMPSETGLVCVVEK